MTSCDQFRELFEAYALGAMDAEERASLEAHLLTGCKDCAKSIEGARWLVSQLAYLAPQAAPSDMLKGRLMQTVRGEATAAQTVKKFKPIAPVWLLAGIAALVLFSLYSTFEMRVLRHELEHANSHTSALLRERAEVEGQLIAANRQAIILTDPASVKIALASKDPQMPQLEAMWHSQLGMVLTGQKIPMPSGNHVLQLWLIPRAPGAKPMPSLTLRPDADGKFVFMVSNPPESMANTKTLAITEEPAGGSQQPTSSPIWVGAVS